MKKVAVSPSNAVAPVHGDRTGMLGAVWYFLCATIFAIAAYQLNSIANKPVFVGVAQYDFVSNFWSVPVTTYLHIVDKPLLELNVTGPISVGSQSLADLKYDECSDKNNATCAAKYEPNENKVFFVLGASLAIIPNFDAPEYQTRTAFNVTYTNNLFGWNSPVVMYHYNDPAVTAVVCTMRRAVYRVASATSGVTDVFGFCSRRAYDPNWFCENDVPLDTPTYVMKVERGVPLYLGQAPRGAMHWNPGKDVPLTGSPAGNGILSQVPSVDDYNYGLLLAQAPWDIVAHYNCKKFNEDGKLTGWLYEGQGVMVMTWTSPQLMSSNAAVLCSMTLFALIIQLRFLRYSRVPITPMYMAKEVVPFMCAGVAVYGNYNVQVLTTFLHLNTVTEINASLYMSLGPAMIASIAALMNSIMIQMSHNPHVVVSTPLLLSMSVLNWIVVFIFERVIVPTLSAGVAIPCKSAASTSCQSYEAVEKTYFASVFLTAALATVGWVIVLRSTKHSAQKKEIVSPSHSLLKLFGLTQMDHLAVGDLRRCMRQDAKGEMLVDPALMFNKNLLRVSDSCVFRLSTIKYVLLYELIMLPGVSRWFSAGIGPIAAFEAQHDRITRKTRHMRLDQLDLHNNQFVSAYVS